MEDIWVKLWGAVFLQNEAHAANTAQHKADLMRWSETLDDISLLFIDIYVATVVSLVMVRREEAVAIKRLSCSYKKTGKH